MAHATNNIRPIERHLRRVAALTTHRLSPTEADDIAAAVSKGRTVEVTLPGGIDISYTTS